MTKQTRITLMVLAILCILLDAAQSWNSSIDAAQSVTEIYAQLPSYLLQYT